MARDFWKDRKKAVENGEIKEGAQESASFNPYNQYTPGKEREARKWVGTGTGSGERLLTLAGRNFKFGKSTGVENEPSYMQRKDAYLASIRKKREEQERRKQEEWDNRTLEERDERMKELEEEKKKAAQGSIFLGNRDDGKVHKLELEIEKENKERNEYLEREFATAYQEAQKINIEGFEEKKKKADSLRKTQKEMKKQQGQLVYSDKPGDVVLAADLEEEAQKVKKKADETFGLERMTQEESKTYLYLQQKRGDPYAQAYLQYMQEAENQREGEEIADEYIEKGTLGKAAFTVQAGTDQFVSGIRQLASEEALPTSPYQYASAKVKDSIQTFDIAGYDVGQAAYDLGTTISNMAPSIIASAATGGILGPTAAAVTGSGSMALSAKGNAYKQAIEEGYTKKQASTYSTLIGGMEGALQYALGGVGKLGGKVSGKALSKATKNIESVAGRIAADLGGKMLSEGTEEYIQEIAEPVIRNIAFDENNEFKPFTADALYSGILGALSAGTLEGVGTVVEIRGDAKIGENINQFGMSEELLNTAMQTDQDTEAYKLAWEMRNGETKQTNVNMGELYRNTVEAEDEGRIHQEREVWEEPEETIGNETEGRTMESEKRPAGMETAESSQEEIRKNEEEETIWNEGIEEKPSMTETSKIESEITKEEQTSDIRNEQKKTGNRAYIRSDKATYKGEDVSIRGIEKMEGEVFADIETKEGITTVPLEEVTSTEEETGKIYERLSRYGESGAKNIIANYETGSDADTYLRGYDAYYNAGMVELPYNAVNSAYGSMLRENVRMEAYTAGINDRRNAQKVQSETRKTAGKQKVIAGLQETAEALKLSAEMRTVLDGYGKISGTGIVIEKTIEGGKANGYYDGNGTIHLAADSENPLNVVMNHELTHYMKDKTELYDGYKDYVLRYMTETHQESVEQLIEAQIDAHEEVGKSITRDEAMDEIVANATELFLTDRGAVEELAKNNRSIAEKVLDYLKGIIQKIQKMMRDVLPTSTEARILNEELEVAKEAERLWMEALADANGKKIGAERYSLKKDFKEKYDNWDGKNARIAFEVGSTSEALKSIGVEDKKIVWDAGKIIKIKAKHKAMTDVVIKQVPEVIENPIIIMRSRTDESRITMFGEVFDAAGDPVLAVLELHPEKRGIEIDEIKIASAYGKNSMPQQLLNNSEVLYIDKNKKRTQEWMKRTGLQLPVGNIQTGSTNSIQQSKEESNKKIWSLKEEGTGVEYYQRENQKQREIIEILQKRLDAMRHIEPDQNAIRVAVEDILKRYESKYPKDQAIETMERLWDYIANSEHVDGEEVVQITSGLAKQILERSQRKNTKLAEKYKELRRKIRSTKINVNEQAKEEIDNKEGYNAFRKRNMGTMKLSIGEGNEINTFYAEVSGKYPELFDVSRAENDGDKLLQISEAMQITKPFYENPYGMNQEEATRDLAYQLYENYFNIQRAKSPIENAEIRRLNKLQSQYREEIKKLRESYQKKEKQMYEKYQKKQGKVASALQKQREVYAEAKEKRERGRRETRIRQSIKKTGMEMSKWLVQPTDKAHVPESLRKTMLEFLSQIDFTNARAKTDSKSNMDLASVMNALKRELTNATNGENGSVMDLDPDAIPRIEELIEKASGKKDLSEMGERDLAELDKTMKAIKTGITRINEMYIKGDFRYISDAAKSTIDHLGKEKDKERSGRIDTLLNVSMLDSRAYLYEMGEGGKAIYKALRKGQDKKVVDIEKTQKYMEKAMEGWTKKQVQEMTKEAKTFKVRGKEIKLTKAQIMSLAMLMKRPQAKNHILKGGVKIAETKVNKVGGEKVYGYKKTVYQTRAIHLDELECSKIVKTLTAEELELAGKIQKFMASECAKWGNETSLEMYGYEKFKDPEYFPIEVDKAQVKASDGSQNDNVSLYAIKNQGMTKALTKGANNAIVIRDIFDVLTSHATKMASYHAYAEPLMDAMRWYNYAEKTGKAEVSFKSVQSEIRNKRGEESKKYFIKLLKSINGETVDDAEGKLVNWLISNYKAAAVGANLRVVIQQPTAIVRALDVMEPKYLIKGINPAKALEGMREAKEHSSIAKWKSWGYYETMVGKSMKEVITGQQEIMDKIRDKGMALAGYADDITWGALWNACKEEIGDTKKDLKPGTEEYYKAVTERFDDIIDQTQVVDTVLHRTQYMRNTGLMAKQQTAFMAEPSKSYNMLRNAVKTGDRKRIARALFVYGLNAAVGAAAAALVDGLRDDDEYEKYLNKVGNAFVENAADGINPINMIPIAKEIPSIFDGFSSSRMDTQVFTTMYKTMKTLESEEKNWWDKTEAVANALSQVTGIPARNLMREFESVYNAITERNIGTPSRPASERVKLINEAIMNGDEETAKRITEDLEKMGKDKEYIQRQMSKLQNEELKEKISERDQEGIQEVINKISETKGGYGKEEKEIKASVKRTITGALKEEYEEGKNRNEIRGILLNLKLNGKRIFDEGDLKGWEKK